jgi:glycosyltransferase involved in cell wall biosynthesis
MSLRRIFERAWGYYRVYGARRFLWAVGFKVRQRLAQSAFLREQRRQSQEAITEFPSRHRVEAPNRPAQEVFRSPFVAIIGDLNLPQCKKYRVIQKLEILEALGVRSSYSHWEDIPRALDLLQTATFVIFYRAPLNALFQTYVDECARLKVTTAYDIDDPLFSEAIFGDNPNLAFLAKAESKALVESVGSYLGALKACDVGICSTPRLMEEMSKLTGRPVFLWRNAMDRETQHAVSQAGVSDDHGASGPLEIIYCSGSRAHEQDFREIESDLVFLLAENPDVHLTIIGYLDVPSSLQAFSDRLNVHPFSGYAQYIRVLSRSDISIVPLVPNAFNDCKSAIRYMEAALLGVPSVTSHIGDFVHLVSDGTDGFTASSSQEWREKLQSLIDNAGLRRRMGAAARDRVAATLTTDAVAASLPDKLKDIIHGT